MKYSPFHTETFLWAEGGAFIGLGIVLWIAVWGRLCQDWHYASVYTVAVTSR